MSDAAANAVAYAALEEDDQIVTMKKARPMRRLNITENDLPAPLADDVIEYAQQALDDATQSTKQKNLAQYIKQKLDAEKGGTWHVLVGSHFGCNVTNDAGTLINFQLASNWFTVFRSGPPEKVANQMNTSHQI